MISAMPAVAVRREREKNRQGKLIGDTFGRGITYIPSHHLHHLPPSSYYHHHNPHHNHHHQQQHSSSTGKQGTTSTHNNNSPNVSTEDKNHLRFLIFTGVGCLVIGIVCLFIGIVTVKTSTQIIGFVFIGLGGLFCAIKFILDGKSNSSSSNNNNNGLESAATTTVNNNNHNSNDLNLTKTSPNQPLVDSRKTIKLSNSTENHSKPLAETNTRCNDTNQISPSSTSPSTDQCLAAS